MTTTTRTSKPRQTKSSRSASKNSGPKSSRSDVARELAALEQECDRRQYERDFLAFAKRGWEVLEPGTPLLVNWHHELLAEYLTAVAHGSIRRLIVNMPPRHTKSRFTTVLWPCWVWATQPATNWIFGSYAASLSTSHSVDRRTLLVSDWYRSLWGHRVQFTKDQDQKTLYQNTARGQMFSTSVGGTVLGMGADNIVVDDPHNPQQVLSDVERPTALRWFDQQLSTRLNDPKTGAIIVIMQRLHEADLTGHLAEHQGVWSHLTLRSEAETDERIVFPISGRVVERRQGDVLDATRFGKAVLEDQKRQMGSWSYAGQFQQRPTPLGGGIFKRDWFVKRWHTQPERFDELVQSWDCAFKETQDSDYVVGQLWGRVGATFFLLDQVRDHMSFTATVNTIANLPPIWKQAGAKLVEDKANGTAVIDTLKHRVSGLIAVEPEGGKVARAQAVSPLCEAQNVVLPAEAPWLHDFLHEVCAFPGAAHDDQVDAMTQALHRMKTGAASAATWTQIISEMVLGDAREASNIARGTVRTRG